MWEGTFPDTFSPVSDRGLGILAFVDCEVEGGGWGGLERCLLILCVRVCLPSVTLWAWFFAYTAQSSDYSTVCKCRSRGV